MLGARSRRSTVVERSPATTCAFVTTIPGAATQPLPSWISLHASPVTFTIERRTAASTAGVSFVVGAVPGSGGLSSGSSADGYGASEIARPHAANCAGCFGRDPLDRGHDPRVARHAGRPPLRGRERRDDHPGQHEQAERADRRARDPVPERQRARQREDAVHEQADDEAERLPDRRDEEEEQERDADAVVGGGAAETR